MSMESKISLSLRFCLKIMYASLWRWVCYSIFIFNILEDQKVGGSVYQKAGGSVNEKALLNFFSDIFVVEEELYFCSSKANLMSLKYCLYFIDDSFWSLLTSLLKVKFYGGDKMVQTWNTIFKFGFSKF